eukprot:202343-Rhodomonas_salina.2
MAGTEVGYAATRSYMLINGIEKLPDFAQKRLSTTLLRNVTSFIYKEKLRLVKKFRVSSYTTKSITRNHKLSTIFARNVQHAYGAMQGPAVLMRRTALPQDLPDEILIELALSLNHIALPPGHVPSISRHCKLKYEKPPFPYATPAQCPARRFIPRVSWGSVLLYGPTRALRERGGPGQRLCVLLYGCAPMCGAFVSMHAVESLQLSACVSRVYTAQSNSRHCIPDTICTENALSCLSFWGVCAWRRLAMSHVCTYAYPDTCAVLFACVAS